MKKAKLWEVLDEDPLRNACDKHDNDQSDKQTEILLVSHNDRWLMGR